MRAAILLLAFGVLPTTGCSAFITGSGKDLAPLEHRVKVHEAFGPPVATGVEDGRDYEEFMTHRKISERWKGIYITMSFACTAGLSELIVFPDQLYTAVRRSVVGQCLRFTYDDEGNVIAVDLDGDRIPLLGRPFGNGDDHKASSQTPSSTTTEDTTLDPREK